MPLSIELKSERCIRAHNHLSQCDACIRACPFGALEIGKPITLHASACVVCGACLQVCPVDAFSGDDGLGDLRDCLARLNTRVVELACARHPSAETGPADSTAIVRIQGCLAMLGISVYVWILTRETEKLIVRLDACAQCQLGKIHPHISHTLSEARDIAASNAECLIQVSACGDGWIKRPVIPAKNPLISRRDLFRVLAGQAPQLVGQLLPFEGKTAANEKMPPRERRRLLNVLQHTAERHRDTLTTVLTDGFTQLAASGQCTACGACASVCPTGAMRMVMRDADFRLTFAIGACTNCGACLDLCEPKALSRVGVPTIDQVTATEPMLLVRGPLRRCRRCGARFGGPTPGVLCSACNSQPDSRFAGRPTMPNS